MFLVRWMFLNICLLGLAFFSSGCGRIWGTVTWDNNTTYPSSAFAYQCSTQVFLDGYSNTANAPALSGSGFSYTISPALPSGLSMNSSTGVISGTPTGTNPMTTYTITITYPGGSTITGVNLRAAVGWLVNDLTHDAVNSGGLGSCSIAGFNTCTLRAAIDEINTGGSSRTVILLPAGSTTISHPLGALSPTQPVDIYGDCAATTTVDGGGTTQIFNVVNSGNISFNFLTLQNGLIPGNSGGAIGVANSGVGTFTVNINNSTVQNNMNTANNGAGAVFIEGSAGGQVNVSISNTTFNSNQNTSATGLSGGIQLGFGGGNTFVQTTITNSSFISNNGGPSNGGPGAISYNGNGLTITDSLFYNNTATGSGGAGAIVDIAGPAIILTNDTFDSNSNLGLASAGVINSSATINTNNCTFANNSGNSAGVFRNAPSGNLANNIFYNNSGSSGPPNNNCNGTAFTSLGGNLSDQGSADCTLTQGTDIVSTPANLQALQSNGGPTQTMALLPTSHAIGAAIVGNCPTTDQRGDARHLPTSCDIGAWEHQP